MTPTSAVVVCTYTARRWPELCAAIASVRAQRPRPLRVVLVVDHDEDLGGRARASFPDLTVLENVGRRGLSGARNTAVAHLGRSVDVIAFLDDDAVARDGWLSALLAPYRNRRVAGVGGPAYPRWPGGTAPAVLPRELRWVVGCTYAGQYPERASGPSVVRNLMGCSMSVRADLLVRLGGFAEELGRVGSTPLGGEETDLCIRATQLDPCSTFVLTPDAAVDHQVSPERTTMSYVWRRAYAEGVTKAALAERVGSRDGLASERAYTRSVLPAAVRRELTSALREPRSGHDHLLAAAAIVVAVGAAATGYLRGRAAGRLRGSAGARRSGTVVATTGPGRASAT
ncbi:glycosyltransferase family 2 protein [Actinomycetospora termitidis]|uniref:Glycosyltransferase n=1 Tax=Actinomycetospora termitidis TaxID=3053470 RepID=A0ABT7MJP9_9PSEU|nr:glycosyltransferase [Actinomycetospora sp. Odt1-22]MDL5160142.1 glycosyltransferase [Actinomycetospora sp. Odt1-22]